MFSNNIKFNCNLWYTQDWTLEMQAWEEETISRRSLHATMAHTPEYITKWRAVTV